MTLTSQLNKEVVGEVLETFFPAHSSTMLLALNTFHQEKDKKTNQQIILCNVVRSADVQLLGNCYKTDKFSCNNVQGLMFGPQAALGYDRSLLYSTTPTG